MFETFFAIIFINDVTNNCENPNLTLTNSKTNPNPQSNLNQVRCATDQILRNSSKAAQ